MMKVGPDTAILETCPFYVPNVYLFGDNHINKF